MLSYKVFTATIFAVSLLGCNTQAPPNPDKELVTKTFELFFESLRQKDSTTFKSVIYRPQDSRWFFMTFSGNKHKILSSGKGRVGAIIREVGSENSLYGKCGYNFDSISVRIYHRYATVSANYLCYVNSDSLDHSGTYTIHFLKPDDWKIERVIRYIHVPDK